MRLPRVRPPQDAAYAYYHCTSRIVDRVRRLGDVEKEYFVRQLRRYEAFCGVRIITYTVMGNHFHLLVEVPKPPRPPPTPETLLDRLEAFYSPSEMIAIRTRLAAAANDPERITRWMQPYLNRMWNISRFMQELKQTFSRWYNRRAGRVGTLWEGRYRCSLVEGQSLPMAVVAGYIDLNPVRARLVEDPIDYRWNGYAEAVAGNVSQARALESVLPPGLQSLEAYRRLIHCRRRQSRAGPDPAAIAQAWKDGGRLTAEQLVRCRVRYLVEGVVIGSRGFVNEVFVGIREFFNPRRTEGARRLRGVDPPIYSLKRFRLRPVTAPEPRSSSAATGPP